MEGKHAGPSTIDEYIAGFPEDVRHILAKIRETVRAAAPEAVERVSYQMPGFFQEGPLVWFAAHKHHIGLYPHTFAMIEAIPELSAYKRTKGSVHFPLDEPIPYELIDKIVKVRVAENTGSKVSAGGERVA